MKKKRKTVNENRVLCRVHAMLISLSEYNQTTFFPRVPFNCLKSRVCFFLLASSLRMYNIHFNAALFFESSLLRYRFVCVLWKFVQKFNCANGKKCIICIMSIPLISLPDIIDVAFFFFFFGSRTDNCG